MVPLGKAIEAGTMEVDGKTLKYFILEHPSWSTLPAYTGYDEGYNGYVIFPKRPVRESNYSGILTFVPVWGGITYAQQHPEGMVYGFDTGHIGQENLPVRDLKWIKKQIEIMARGILKAAEVEKHYLRCISTRGKAKWAQKVLDICPDQSWNLGVGLVLLGGDMP